MSATVRFSHNVELESSSLLVLIVEGSADAPVLYGDLPDAIQTKNIDKYVQSMDFASQQVRTVAIDHAEKIQWVALCSLGDATDALALKQLVDSLTHKCVELGCSALAIQFNHFCACFDKDIDVAFLVAYQIAHSAYRFTRYKSQGGSVVMTPELIVCTTHSDTTNVQRAQAINKGTQLSRDLANTAPNDCTVDYMYQQCVALADNFSEFLHLQVVDQQQMQQLGFGAFLAVSKGSYQQAKLVVMEYKHPAYTGKPVALLGKGIVFDTGGISLKPAVAMDEMKFDMCGSAAVVGSCHAICELAPKAHIIFAIALAENMPGGGATRPGDIVTTLSGKTVEILNTDAEGRLVLCDSLTWLQQTFQPSTIVDVATLTGACVVALGHHASALFANDDRLAENLLHASTRVHDGLWRMPLWREYQQQLSNSMADVPNISGGRDAGCITAACFLSRFIEEGVAWAHLDIAGTAWKSGKDKIATGRPVPLLTQYLLDACSA